MMTRVYTTLAALSVTAVLGGAAGWYYVNQGADPYANCRGGQIGADIGGPFTLVDGTGTTVTSAEVLARPALVYFGYTFCPDVCPFDNARNAEAVDILEERGYDVTPVFISIDPGRDTPEVMAEMVQSYHPRMIGLTGSEDQVKAAAQAYKAYYRKQATEDEFYLVDHSTFTYLMLPGVGFVDFFRREDTADQMADRVACFLQ